MKGAIGELVSGFGGRSLRAGGIVAVLMALVGVVGGLPLGLVVVLAVVSVALSLAVRGTRSPAAQEYGLVPALVALGVMAVLASPTFLVGALAGLAGFSVLLWNSETPREPRARADPVDGLLLPGVGLAVALLAAATLPAANAAVGLAALSVVVALALVLWALGRAVGDSTAAGQGL